MSIPQNRSYMGQSTLYSTQTDGTQNPPVVSNSPVTKVRSVQPVRKTVPFRYRLKVWTYKGKVYTRLKGYRPKSIRFSPNVWRPPLPYSGNFIQGDVSAFNGVYQVFGYPANPKTSQTSVGDLQTGNYGVTCPAFPVFNTGLESRAVTKALSKLKNQSVNLAVAFAERKETAELLVGTLAGLAKAARSLHCGDMRGVARGLGLSGTPKSPRGRTFPQKWLELQYGWQPLYSDVFGCVNALNQRDTDDAKRYTVAVTGKVRDPFRRFTRTPQVRPCLDAISTDTGFEGCFVRLDYYLENPLLASLSALGITNPAEVVWERVPFSFVVDWFLPVGNYLSSMDAALGYSFRGGSCTRLFRRDWSAGIVPGANASGFRAGVITGTVSCRAVNIDRSVYTSSPLPRIPGFKNPFPQNGRHIANAIALFASSLKG